MTSLASVTPTYDNNGNLTNDNVHSYAWDADGRPTTLDGVTLTFDALDRMVEEKSTSGFTYQDVYSPTGAKLVYMNGQSFLVANIPLLGGAKAIYRSATNVEHYHHSDWLGTSRLSSSPSQTFVASSAFAPFGEPYASSSNADLFFTGQPENTSSGIYDFMYREYPWQGRWPSPDPAGPAAVDPANPQSWHRYAYVFNRPLSNIDPTGLSDCPDLKIGCMPSNECLSGAWCGGFGVDILGGRNFWNGTPYVGIGGGANGVRGGYTTVLVYLPGFSIDEYAPGTDPAGYGGYFDSADYLNFLVWVPGGSDSGGGNSSWAWTFTKSFFRDFSLKGLRLPGESFEACIDRAQKGLLGNTGQTILNGATGVSTVASIFTQPLGTTTVLAPAGKSVMGKLVQVGLDSGATDVSTAYQMSRGAGIVGKVAGVITAIGLGIEGGFAISCR